MLEYGEKVVGSVPHRDTTIIIGEFGSIIQMQIDEITQQPQFRLLANLRPAKRELNDAD